MEVLAGALLYYRDTLEGVKSILMQDHNNQQVQPSMTRADIQAVINKCPWLSAFGAYFPRLWYKYPLEEREERFLEDQQELLNLEKECTHVCRWLSDLEKIKTMNQNSYNLKHMVERDRDVYISNGAFIAAAIHMGFHFKRIVDCPNVDFGISHRSMKEREKRERARGNPRYKNVFTRYTSIKDLRNGRI
jgi:hypothetical protein